MAKVKQWKQLCKEADPDMDKREEAIYEFGAGRKFKERKNPYENNPAEPE